MYVSTFARVVSGEMFLSGGWRMSDIRNRWSLRSGRAATARRSMRMTVVGALVAGLFVPAGLIGAGIDATPAAAAPGDSFAPDAPTVFISQQQEPTKLFKAVQNTGGVQFVVQGSTGQISYNAIGYREADDFIYGMRNGDTQAQKRTLLRIGQGGVVTNLGQIPLLPDLPAGVTWNAGTFGEGADADTYFLRPSFNTSHALLRKLYRVDLVMPESPTAALSIDLVDENGNSVMVPNTSDIVYKDGFVWGFYGEGKKAYRIDPITGVTSVFAFDFDGSTWGAQWVYGNGNVGLSANLSGAVQQIEIVGGATDTPVFRRVSKIGGPSSNLNDGTSKQGIVDLGVIKSAPDIAIGGSSFQFELVVTNHSTTASSGFVLTDAVPTGLTNVSTNTFGCTVTGNDVNCVGDELAGGASRTVRILATMPAGSTECVTNVAQVLGNEADPVADNNSDSARVCPGQPDLRVFKMSDATEDTRQGDVVTYTVSISNSGAGNYTVENPAIATDDLSDVLDDADYNNDATYGGGLGTLSYSAPRLTWSGPLPAGQSVIIRYSVTLKNAGNGVVRNVVFQGSGTTPECNPPTEPDWHDAATGVPCFEEEYLLPRLEVRKSADPVTLPANSGDITYTVEVINRGPGTTSIAEPATMTDDLSQLGPGAVVDPTSITSTVGTASIAGSTIDWSGVLDAGESAFISYDVHYTAMLDPVGQVINTACVPVDITLPGAESCATVTLRSNSTAMWKEVSASSDPIVPGTTLSYTLYFTNDGATPYVVDVVDDLNDVLDDTSMASGPTVTGPSLSANYVSADGQIAITGTLTSGQNATVSYTVTVKPEADRGNNRAVNFVIEPGTTPPPTCVPDPDMPECTDTPLPGSLIWQKLDDNYTPIGGSEWVLTPTSAAGVPTGDPAINVVDCVQANVAGCTGADKDPAAGGFQVSGLNYGHYRLTETVPPAGYLLSTSLIPIIALNGAVLDIGHFLNFQQLVPAIPLTGGLGEDGFKVAAAAAFAAMAGFLIWRVRRRQI